MFFGAGEIVSAYKTHAMKSIRGVIEAMPFVGIMTLLGVFALTGFPPFSIFISELVIIMAAFLNGSYVVAGCLLVFLAVIFGAFMYHFGEMLFGRLPQGMAVRREALSGKLAFLFLFGQMCLVGIALVFMKETIIWIAKRLLQI